MPFLSLEGKTDRDGRSPDHSGDLEYVTALALVKLDAATLDYEDLLDYIKQCTNLST